jgi:hypothetical protein
VRIATGTALILGLLAGVAAEARLHLAVNDRNETARQVQQCIKANQPERRM